MKNAIRTPVADQCLCGNALFRFDLPPTAGIDRLATRRIAIYRFS